MKSNKSNESNIVVWDAMMGQGKTTKVIQYMLQEHRILKIDSGKFLYVSPYLSEAHRIAGTSCKDDDVNQLPILNENGAYIYDSELPQSVMQFKHPSNRNSSGSKLQGLCNLLSAKENVVSTHNLISVIKPEQLEDLQDYTLVIDEALDVFNEETDITQKTFKHFLDINILSIDEDGHTVRFNRENYGKSEDGKDTTEGGDYEGFAIACDRGLVYKVGSRVVRKFDVTILSKFKKVIIMTYMFKGSMFDLLLQKEGLSYDIEYFGATPKSIKHLINLNMNEKDNAIGDYPIVNGVKDYRKHKLTATDYKRNKDTLNKTMFNRLNNMWQQRQKVKPEARLWTCYTPNKMGISKGTAQRPKYSNQWLAFNTKATNDYVTKTDLAFLVNVFIDGNYISACSKDGLRMSQDHYALSTLVQWVFRSAIREGKPINLYIPSERMRNLFILWLNGEVITYEESK